MLFRTIYHYLSYNDELQKKCEMKDNECFICYEVSSNYEKNTIELQKQTEYITLCECNGFIHKGCLHYWVTHSMKCPICRNPICIRKSKPTPFFYKFIIQTFPTLAGFLAFIYYTSEFYISILKSKETYEHLCITYENSSVCQFISDIDDTE